MSETQKSLTILSDWGDVVAIEKPAGWLSIPGRGNKENVPVVSNILGAQLRALDGCSKNRGKEPDLFIVHRLDEGTSGVMIFAKTPQAHRELSHLFENEKIKKTYWCVVKGTPRDQTISEPIFKIPSKKIKSVVDPKGKPSTTDVRTLLSRDGFSLVEAKPLTGRSHQIRVHLSHIGNPLVGDPLYGGTPQTHGHLWPHPLLHCRCLQFEWPKGELRSVSSMPQGNFAKSLEQMGFNEPQLLSSLTDR